MTARAIPQIRKQVGEWRRMWDGSACLTGASSPVARGRARSRLK